jgi:alpha-mannosidase
VSQAPRQAFLVSHTHWDREWYLTFERFRVNLMDVVDGVLDALENDPEFKHFVLDGQAAVLEDYLDAAPEQRERVARLVKDGRLAVGPWYILPDEFLVSGESTVRNLIHGAKVTPGKAVQEVGYMPDSFVFTRGMGDEGTDLGWLFRWAGPDGSEVLAVNQCDGYCNAGGLGFDEIWHAHTRRAVDPAKAVKKIGALFEKMAARPGCDPALLNNGCDHFPAQQKFGTIIGALKEAFPDTEFNHVRFEDFLAAARAHTPDADRPRREGELLGGRDHLILSGVWSARMNLKQQNEVCQNLLAAQWEPLEAAEHFLDGRRWPSGLLDLAWKDLLRNHPHDSICGCSTDGVHRDMETRFAGVRRTAEQGIAKLLDRRVPMFAPDEADDRATVLAVANPLPMVRDEVIDRLVVLQPLDYDLSRLRLKDEQGRDVPFTIVKKRYLERFWGIDYRQELTCDRQLALLDTYLRRFGDRIIGTEDDRDTHDCFLHLRFLARDLPAVGHARFFLTDDGQGPSPAPERAVRASGNPDAAVLENEHLTATLSTDGSFDLLDRATGHEFKGLNLLEDAEDCGDEYDYSPAEGNALFFSAGASGKVKIVQADGLAAVAEAQFRFDLPRSLERDRQSRNPKTTPCDVTVRLTLRAGARRVDVATEFNNRAFDHRLRAWFPTGIATDTVTADGHFMLNARPVVRPSNEDWDQPAPPNWPQQDFAFLEDDEGGLAVFNRGLPEFETFDDGSGGVIYALTLMRAVDWLSRDDFSSRKCTNAGPTLHTPDAQLIGRHTFEYAVMPFTGGPFAADLKGESDRYRTIPATHQGVVEGSLPGGVSFVRQTDPRVAVTAIKKAEDDDRLIIRLYNQSTEPAEAELHLGLAALTVAKTGLREDDLELGRAMPVLEEEGCLVRVPLGPCEIATVACTLPKEGP